MTSLKLSSARLANFRFSISSLRRKKRKSKILPTSLSSRDCQLVTAATPKLPEQKQLMFDYCHSDSALDALGHVTDDGDDANATLNSTAAAGDDDGDVSDDMLDRTLVTSQTEGDLCAQQEQCKKRLRPDVVPGGGDGDSTDGKVGGRMIKHSWSYRSFTLPK